MIQSLDKELNRIVRQDRDSHWQRQEIYELVKVQLQEMQEALRAEEFSTGNWTEEMDDFLDIYIENI